VSLLCWIYFSCLACPRFFCSSFSSSEWVDGDGEKFCAGFCPKLLFLSWTFFRKKKNYIEIFYNLNALPYSRAVFIRPRSNIPFYPLPFFPSFSTRIKFYFYFFFSRIFIKNHRRGCGWGGMSVEETWKGGTSVVKMKKNWKSSNSCTALFCIFFFFLPFLIGFFFLSLVCTISRVTASSIRHMRHGALSNYKFEWDKTVAYALHLSVLSQSRLISFTRITSSECKTSAPCNFQLHKILKPGRKNLEKKMLTYTKLDSYNYETRTPGPLICQRAFSRVKHARWKSIS
jgi:hypothetical protein